MFAVACDANPWFQNGTDPPFTVRFSVGNLRLHGCLYDEPWLQSLSQSPATFPSRLRLMDGNRLGSYNRRVLKMVVVAIPLIPLSWLRVGSERGADLSAFSLSPATPTPGFKVGRIPPPSRYGLVVGICGCMAASTMNRPQQS